MGNLLLVKPEIKYQSSFKKYCLIYKEINDEHYFNKYRKALENFQEYLEELDNFSKGKGLPQGRVSYSTFWLISENEVVGVVRIRHQEVESGGHIGYDISPVYRKKGYGFQILKLALKKALEIGLKEVIVTCSINNIASKKIIEKNSGKLLGTIYDEEEDEYLYKYSIILKGN